MNKAYNRAIFYALLAAALYALNSPLSKLLLGEVPPVMMAAFLYLGAGIGLFCVNFCSKRFYKNQKEAPLTKKELPYTAAMIVLDIFAPILLMFGLMYSSAESVSLLNNFEIVATSIIAFSIFREKIPKKLLIGIILITAASIVLSAEDISGVSFSFGSLFVLGACVCWGFENNCTKMLSSKDPIQIVIIKGFGSGLGSLIVALICRESFPKPIYIPAALITGFFAYGLSIFFYIHAQRRLGAARTSAYYAVAPFIGVVLSLLIFRQMPSVFFFIALPIMAIGTYFAGTE